METKPSRRTRRSKDEILSLIQSSALQLFAERGYEGTTTQEIARRADVSETLLFRHFGSKAVLYDAVVSAPFLQIMQSFEQDQRQIALTGNDTPNSRAQGRALYDFFDENRDLFTALLLDLTRSDTKEPMQLAGLEQTFRRAADEITATYERMAQHPPFDVSIAVRLSFGMIAAAVLMRPLLFSSSEATSEEIRETIVAMSASSLWPSPSERPSPSGTTP